MARRNRDHPVGTVGVKRACDAGCSAPSASSLALGPVVSGCSSRGCTAWLVDDEVESIADGVPQGGGLGVGLDRVERFAGLARIEDPVGVGFCHYRRRGRGRAVPRESGSATKASMFSATQMKKATRTKANSTGMVSVLRWIWKYMRQRKKTMTVAKTAVQQGMTTLREDGWAKVKLGLTSVEEVLRVAV